MMLKLKITTTVFVLYEIIAVLLLHNMVSCNAMFGMHFCSDSVFKYFIALFAVPAVAGLIYMWIMHIIHAIRRRHSFLYRAQEAFEDVTESIKKTLRESVSGQDIEKYIVAALATGMQRYSQRNPRLKESVSNILNNISKRAGDVKNYMNRIAEYTEYTDDDEYDDDESERATTRSGASTSHASHRTTSARNTGSGRSTTSGRSSARHSQSGSSRTKSGSSRR